MSLVLLVKNVLMGKCTEVSNERVTMSHWRLFRTIAVGYAVIVVGLFSVNHVGATLSLQTSFNVSGTYTDNLSFRNEDSEDDFGTFFGPNVTLLYENPDIVIGATYIGRVSLFVNNSNGNRYNQNANIMLDLPFLTKQYRGLTVTINESMIFTPQLDAFSLSEAQDASSSGGRPTNASSGGTGGTGAAAAGFNGTGGTQGVVARRADAFVNRAGVTLGYAWTPLLNTSLGYTNQYRHFFSKGFQDSLTHQGIFSVPYRVTPFTKVSPSYSYRQTNFIGKSTQTTSADRIISHSVRLGLTHNFTATFSGTISGGISFVKQEGATELVPVAGGGVQEREVSSKFVRSGIGSVNLTKTFARGSIGLSARQNIGSGGGLGAQATTTRTVTGQGTYSLTPRMNAFVSVGWGQNKSVDGNGFDTNTYSVQTGVGYTVTRWLFGNVGYSRIDQRSKGTVATDVVVNQVFMGLTAVADPWFLIR